MSDTEAGSSKTPMELAEEELGCDEHEIVLYKSGGNYGRCCKRCGEKVGHGWISHSDLTEEEKGEAIDNRKEIEKEFRGRVWTRMREIEREGAPTLSELLPGRDASPVEWRDAFDVLDDQRKEIRDELWEDLYDEYLNSEAWKETRERALGEKGDECAANLSVCDETATEVHHRSYEHLGTEPMWDLMPVCSSCHDVLHRVEGEDNFSGDESSISSDPESSSELDYDDLFGVPALNE